MKHCRIMFRPWRVPTLVSYPPPPPEPARPRPLLLMPAAEAPRAPVRRLDERSATRRRRDCVFIPNMDIAMQFIEARRRAADLYRSAHLDRDRDLTLPMAFDTPLVLGLLMMVLPPVAVTMVWSTSRFSRTAQVALTLYGVVVTVAAAAVLITALS
jgi:hypothetical protein